MSALTFLAAAIPIGGSLYVAVTFLIDQAELAREQRVRFRVKAHIDAVRDSIKRGDSPASPEWRAGSARYAELEMRWLGYFGVAPTLGSYTAMAVASAMSAAPMPRPEVERQWVLLVSATAGLILLALDGLAG